MTRFKLTVSYDGTAYCGWQVQPNGVTVQEKLEQAILRLTGEQTKVHGSGRTDQGVHARGQVAHTDIARPFPPSSLVRAMNAVLPLDIRILSAVVVGPTFHARRSTTGKEYRYFIWNAPVVPPWLRCYRTHVRQPLDVDRMREAAGPLVGRHDFAAFTANPSREVLSTVRTLSELKVTRRGSEVVIVARGEGFLYKMVRSLAGFLIQVGGGSVPSSAAPSVLASRTRTANVPTARPEGLFLWRVTY